MSDLFLYCCHFALDAACQAERKNVSFRFRTQENRPKNVSIKKLKLWLVCSDPESPGPYFFFFFVPGESRGLFRYGQLWLLVPHSSACHWMDIYTIADMGQNICQSKMDSNGPRTGAFVAIPRPPRHPHHQPFRACPTFPPLQQLLADLCPHLPSTRAGSGAQSPRQ